MQGCEKGKSFYLPRDKEMAIINLPSENFTCRIQKISFTLLR